MNVNGTLRWIVPICHARKKVLEVGIMRLHAIGELSFMATRILTIDMKVFEKQSLLRSSSNVNSKGFQAIPKNNADKYGLV